MTTYTAPIEDMMFLYEKLRNNKNYNEIEKYKEITPDLVKDILDEAAKINQNIILPLGISFFTFKHILYLIECYNSHYKTTYTLLNYATYITFFPHLIAGPLSKPKEIIPQLIKNSPITFHNLNIQSLFCSNH